MLETIKGSKKSNLSELAVEKGNANGLKKLYCGLEWDTDSKIDLDIMAIACDKDGKGIKAVYWGTTDRKWKSIEISPDNRDGEDAPEPNKFGFSDDEFVFIDKHLPEGVHHVDIVLSVYNKDEHGDDTDFTFGDCDEAFARLVDVETGAELEKLVLDTKKSDATGIVFGYITEKNGDLIWKKVVEELEGDLDDIFKEYGLK